MNQPAYRPNTMTHTRIESFVVAILFIASGAAALIYEVLWLKQLGSLFGNTAQAAAATLAVFFLGISSGARAWGGRAARSNDPLRAYAILEVAIAGSALLYFGLLDFFYGLYPKLATSLQDSPGLFATIRLLLAAVILFPPAFFMGGTMPFMSQHLMRRRDELGATFSWLYASNTIGAALGAFAAAFLLPPALGFRRSYFVAMALNLAVAAVAMAWSRRTTTVMRASAGPATREPATGAALPATWISAVAFFSGAATLGLEVLWTRMFAQVLHNSVYSFATILVTFLITLALGAFVAHRLCRLRTEPATVLTWILVVAGLTSGLSPTLFHFATGGMGYVAPQAGWWAYVGAIFATAGAVLLLPGISMGVVFPYLLRLAGTDRATAGGTTAGGTAAGGTAAGETVGRLTSWNTIGSILGSLLCGFVLVDWLGIWASVRSIAFAYLALALLLAPGTATVLRAVAVTAMGVVLVLFDPARLPLVLLEHEGEFVRETWETGQAIVAVTQAGNELLLKVDNYYSLGGTSGRTYEQTQADVPLVLHPNPKRVLFLGMGTGITAGTALHHRVQNVTVCEIIPEVITAARRHFRPYTNGLFDDPRVQVLVADGRQHLLTTPERYDVIISDLFIPWQAGTGSMYTYEHFQRARSRLERGGMFVQWLPLYQLSKRDALVIVRTMLDAFPQVTLWRGDFLPEQPIVALIGQEEGARLDPDAITENFRHRRHTPDLPRRLAVALSGLFYAGNLTANRALFENAAVNTDDLPLIEYQSPIAQREQAGNETPWFTSLPLAAFQKDLLERLPARQDPYLARLADDESAFTQGGLELFLAVLHKRAQREAEARFHAEAFQRHVPIEVYNVFRNDVEGRGQLREKEAS